MIGYIVRRLLLMIPTLFGVTIVAFAIMQMAPGDPLLNQGDGRGGEQAASREVYLAQKRTLGLDKPVLLNFNGFHDFGPQLQIVVEVLGQPVKVLTRELPVWLGDADPEAAARRRFFVDLKVNDLAGRLADPQRRAATAQTLVDVVQVWCEDTGKSAVPAALAILHNPQATEVQRRGAVRALNRMLPDPFVYTYGREPSDDETLAVTTSWRLWQKRREAKADPSVSRPPVERRREFEQQLARLIAAPSRLDLMELLERQDKADVPLFLDKLLGDSTLAEKNVSAMVLRLYVGKPLKTDVAADAKSEEVAEVAENWTTYYDVFHADYEPSMRRRLTDVVTDTQYALLVKRLVTFDFGPSALGTHEPVGERIWRAVQVSAPLMIASELVIYLIAIPLGIICAVNRNGFWDRLISFVLFVLYSVPTFVAAMILLLLFCYGGFVHWFPMSGLHSISAEQMPWGVWFVDYAWHAFLPVVCMSLFSLAGLAMYARGSMLDVISEDYIRTARAKGVREPGVIWRHALRNALIPVVTLFADFLPAMLGGSVLIEVLFSIPGMGRLSWASIEQKDYPTLMALIYIDAIAVLLSILLSDILYHFVDPRIQLGSAEEIS